MRGKSEAGRNSSPRTRSDRILNQQPVTITVVWKAVHPIQRYHNPNALVRSIGPFNESPVLIEGQKSTGGELGQYMQQQTRPSELMEGIGHQLERLESNSIQNIKGRDFPTP